jgi:hypothetical protein
MHIPLAADSTLRGFWLHNREGSHAADGRGGEAGGPMAGLRTEGPDRYVLPHTHTHTHTRARARSHARASAHPPIHPFTHLPTCICTHVHWRAHVLTQRFALPCTATVELDCDKGVLRIEVEGQMEMAVVGAGTGSATATGSTTAGYTSTPTACIWRRTYINSVYFSSVVYLAFFFLSSAV